MGNHKKLGQLLVERGYLSEEQLEEAVDLQKRPDETRRLGEILVSRGYVTASQVQVALARQKAMD